MTLMETIMASDTEPFQYALTTCTEHPNEEFFSYCSTCDERICEKCLKGKHKEHEWTSIRNHARKVRKEGITISEKIRKELIPSVQSSKQKEQRESQKEMVLGMQRRMTNLINSYTQYLISLIDGQTSEEKDKDKIIDHLMKLADFFQRHVQTASDNVVVEMEEMYHQTIKQHTQASTQSAKEMVFEEGNLNEDLIKQMFGQLTIHQGDLKATHLNTFRFGTTNILNMVPKSSDQVWAHVSGSTKCTLVNEKGKAVHLKDLGELYNNFIMKDNAHIFSGVQSNAIIRFTDGKLQSIYSTSPLYPFGICESNDGGLLVCLIECHYTKITSTTKGEVHHIDMTGKIIRKYTVDERNQTKLFTYPNKIAMNLNSDLCIVDILNNNLRCAVVAVTMDSKVRFTYEGQSGLGEKFYATDIACNSAGRIILTDFYNNAVHVLSADGVFLQFLLTAGDGSVGPFSITLNADRLWVGCTAGMVNHYKRNFS